MMNGKYVVTNLRIPQENMVQLREIAAGMGMSVNKYFNRIADWAVKEEILGVRRKGLKKLTGEALKNWPKSFAKIKNKPLGLSAEDEIIYGQ